jgi:hypothetical protein
MYYYDTRYRFFGLTFPRSLTTTIQTRAQTPTARAYDQSRSRYTATSVVTALPRWMCSSKQLAGVFALYIPCCHLGEWSRHHADSDTGNSIDNTATYH